MCNCSNNVPTSSCSTCSSCSPVSTCVTCQYTFNSDCVLYTKEKLAFEPASVIDNSTRTLTSVLQSISNSQPMVTSEFHLIEDGGFTLAPDSNDKIIILKSSSGVGNTATIALPVDSLEYSGRVYTFINKTTALQGTWSFGTALQTSYDPLVTQLAYNSISLGTTRILKIAFLQVSATSWAWTILHN